MVDIWPPEFAYQDADEDNSVASSPGGISNIDELPRNAQINCAIDNLLLVTQSPADPFANINISNFQKLFEFHDQLRKRLEEVPDS